MTDGSRAYEHIVFNRDGFVLQYPNVANAEDLLQDTPPNPYAESQYQQYPLGTRLIRGCEEWLYCKNSSAAITVLGTPLQSAAAVHAEQADDIVVGAASAIGAYTVTLTSTANLDGSPNDEDDTFAEGFLIVNDEAGEGQLRKIKSNEGFSITEDSVFTLYDPLTVALTTSSECGLIMNPCKNVLASKAVMTGMFIGVNEIALTASYYFWSKVRGPAAIDANAAVSLGTYVVVGTTAASADPAAAVTTELIIGEPLTPGVTNGEKFIVYLYGR